MTDPGFMIPINANDYYNFPEGGQRNTCLLTNQNQYTQAPWWTNENIQLTGSVDPVTARVGDTVVIQVGLQALITSRGETTPASIQNVEAWVCYPNTVAGGASAMLVVPSMQNSKFASFSNTTVTAPLVADYGAYQVGASKYPYLNFAWISLSPWTPSQDDFLEQSSQGGHCCVIANAAGLADWFDNSGTSGGQPVGIVINDNSQLQADIDVCTNLQQGQRNIMIVSVPSGGRVKPGLVFLSGTPQLTTPMTTQVAVTAINQGSQIDPVILKVLSSGPYAGLPLKPASSPPKSLRLSRHEHQWTGWLLKLIREAEEIVEELLGLQEHPFGGGHRLRLKLPPHGLQPLRMAVELDPTDPPGTVHTIEITQTDPNGARGGIRAGIVVT